MKGILKSFLLHNFKLTKDSINRRMGKESIKLASEGFNKPWKMKQENKSPCYTTNWRELIRVS